MSARIAPRADTMGVGFSPHLPRFVRQRERKDETPRPGGHAAAGTAHHLAGGFVEIEGSMAPETLFEISLIANQHGSGHFNHEEAARRLQEDWSPPPNAFQLTDKTI